MDPQIVVYPSNAGDFQRKIAVLGARSVGKTTMVVQYVESHFLESHYPTMQNEFTKIIHYKKHDYTLEIVDTAGQDEFSLLDTKALADIKGIIICYSVVNRHSLKMVPLIWDKVVDQLGTSNLPIVVVATKTDLRDQYSRQGADVVSTEEGRVVAANIGSPILKDGTRKNQAAFIECSAKLNLYVTEAMMALLKKIEYAESQGGYGGDDYNRCCIV